MRITLSLIALCLAGLVLAQEKSGDAVWKWVDKDGVTHYSDQPGPGATKVDLRLQTYSASPSQPASSSSSRPASRANSYRSVVITSPEAGQTVHGPSASVTLSARLDPPLQGEDTLQFELDGRMQGTPSTANNVIAHDVERGAHNVVVNILGASGALLLQSSPITFYVQQTSILSPNASRQPASPPPRPTPH